MDKHRQLPYYPSQYWSYAIVFVIRKYPGGQRRLLRGLCLQKANDSVQDRCKRPLNLCSGAKPARYARKGLPQGLVGILALRNEGDLSPLELEQLWLRHTSSATGSHELDRSSPRLFHRA